MKLDLSKLKSKGLSRDLSPDLSSLNLAPSIIKRQQGSSLVIALFIMIVFMLLGTAMVRILSTGAETIAYEVLGTRSLAAANSALQADLQQLFP